MFAAAAGNSTLGIPKKVGEEFVGKDEEPDYRAVIQRVVEALKDLGTHEEEHVDEELAATDSALVLALDRDSVRRIDEDGHLHVEQSVISKATVNPYRGGEIPGFSELGLDANKVYNLLRPADELAKAAASFNGKPLLLKHRPINAKDHTPDLVIGSVSNPVFENPDLKAELVIWPQDSIDAIQDGSKREISCGYRYVPVMEPGVFEGMPFDGWMSQISANHVAIIPDGRVSGAVVGDSAEEIQWAALEGALLGLSHP
jgi:hypothetical protein